MEGPVYLMNLGDLTHELYWYEFDFNEEDAYNLLAELELPLKMYSVTGNHDHDGAIVGEDVDFRSAWLYRKFGDRTAILSISEMTIGFFWTI